MHRDIVKFPALFLARLLYRLFMLLPLKEDTILFSAYQGSQYTCNPKYLYEYIRHHFGHAYRLLWVHSKGQMPPGCDGTVRFLSLKHIVALATSRYIVTNLGIEPFFTKREGQIVVNTWHGGGVYKNTTIGGRVRTSLYREYARRARAENTTFFLSSCRAYTALLSDAWRAKPEAFLPVGSPRNDLFFAAGQEEKRREVLKRLGLTGDVGHLLYAPTFRGQPHIGFKFKIADLNLDIPTLLASCEKRFGKPFKFLFRTHINTTGWIPSGENVIDVSDYPDMQELMLVADVFITDYSSSVWDWAITEKLGFLYVPDLDSYDKDRGFYTPIEAWAFPFAKTNADLNALVLSYDETKAREKLRLHVQKLGTFENGKACEMTIKAMGLGAK